YVAKSRVPRLARVGPSLTRGNFNTPLPRLCGGEGMGVRGISTTRGMPNPPHPALSPAKPGERGGNIKASDQLLTRFCALPSGIIERPGIRRGSGPAARRMDALHDATSARITP